MPKSASACNLLGRRTTCDASAPIRASDTRARVALRAGDPVEARNACGGQPVQGERLGRREVVDEGPAADGQVPDELAPDIQALAEVATEASGKSLTDAAGLFESEKFTTAQNNIDQWLTANCN